jgi:hypothetical protein
MKFLSFPILCRLTPLLASLFMTAFATAANAPAPTDQEQVIIKGKIQKKADDQSRSEQRGFRTSESFGPAFTSNPYAPSAPIAGTSEGNKATSTCEQSGTPPPSPTTDHPVIIATGEKFKDEVDFTGGGLYSRGLQRTYRSMQTAGSIFGPNWMSSLEIPKMKVSFANCVTTFDGDCVPATVVVVAADGGEHTFKRNTSYDGGHEHYYSGRGADAGVLTYSWGTWIHYKDNTSFEYSSDGAIQDITIFAQ